MRHMRLLITVFLLSFSVLLNAQSDNDSFDYVSFNREKINRAIGTPFPEFSIIEGGEVVTNDFLKGKVVLVNFWFEGCHPCMAEMDALNELNDSLKANRDFLMISFTWDNPETVERVKKRFGLNFMVLATQQCSKMNFGLGYPTTMILDRVGVIRYIKNGGFLEPEKARKTIFQDIMPEVKRQL